VKQERGILDSAGVQFKLKMQKLLDEGYIVGISDKSIDGFTIQINKKAATDIKLNWTAVETK